MRPVKLAVVALTLGLFSAITFALCILWDLALPAYSMRRLWEAVLPGFRWMTPWSFALGLGESFLYGVYAALVIVPLYNWLSRRISAEASTGGMRHA